MRSEEFITTAIWQGAVLPPSFYVRLFAMIAQIQLQIKILDVSWPPKLF